MKITKGSNRIAVAFPAIGIVVKLPIIHLLRGFRAFWDILKTKDIGLLSKFFRLSVDKGGSLQYLLFQGVVDNLRERRFYKETRHSFLLPTHFSLFGLLNIQRFGRVCTFSCADIWGQLSELTCGAVFKNTHCFENPKNFCMDDGVLQILDYGNLKVQEVVREFGDHIQKSFDPNYSWEKRKKELQEKGQ